MFDRLLSLLSGDAAGGRALPSARLSIACLLIEMARADFEIAEVERARVGALLERHYGLDATAVDQLMREAEDAVNEAVSLHDYLQTLNAELDAGSKRALMQMLWEVAYADQRLDPYEEQLLRKLADLLYVPEKDYIGAKLAVTEPQPSDE